MKRLSARILLASILIMNMICSSGVAFAAGTDENGITYDQVAAGNEMAAIEEVGIEGVSPIYGKDIEDGVYDITVESSSSMFRIEKAVLTVEEGKMQAVMMMSAKGYLKVYMGTAQEAAEAELSEYIDFVVDSEGKHTYTVPVEALDMPVSCAAFSKDREKWYGRALVFEARNMPQEAVKVQLPDYEAMEKAERDARIEALKEENAADGANQAFVVDMKDGEYTVEVVLSGGTGRATITSPAVLRVRDGRAYALIEWDSNTFDYMKIGEQKYLPVNTDGNSTFELPVSAFDQQITVVADTVAMSVPHEIEYTLTFAGDSVSGGSSVMIIVIAAAVLVVLAAVVILIKRKNAKR